MKIGKWTVVSEHKDSNNRKRYLCICECGIEKDLDPRDISKSVKQGNVPMCKSCANKLKNITHGLSNHISHKKWDSMIQRCTNINNASWKYYGAKGITVCDRWLVFENFYKDIGHRLDKGLSIDRIDNSKGYEPNNCRIATSSEQIANRTNHNARFTKEQSNDIIELYQQGLSMRKIAQKYECDHSLIKRIINGTQKYFKKETK